MIVVPQISGFFWGTRGYYIWEIWDRLLIAPKPQGKRCCWELMNPLCVWLWEEVLWFAADHNVWRRLHSHWKVMRCYFQWEERDAGETEITDVYSRQKTINNWYLACLCPCFYSYTYICICISTYVSVSTFVWIYFHLLSIWAFPVVQWVKNLSAMQEPQEMQIQSLGWEDPLE